MCHWSGLVALTHTPSPMGFLNRILQRPKNEKPFLAIPIGYRAANARVPDIQRKHLEEILIQIQEFVTRFLLASVRGNDLSLCHPACEGMGVLCVARSASECGVLSPPCLFCHL